MSPPWNRPCSRTSVALIGLVLLWIVSIASLSDVFAADSTSVRIKVDQVGYLPAVAAMGLWSYALGSGKSADTAIAADIRRQTSQAARAIVESTRLNPYHVSLRARDYVWSSNGVAAAYGMELLVANAFMPDPAFVETAFDNLHYLLGRNTFSLSWATQVGDNPFRHRHHRPSGADKNSGPWPGLLSGVPDAG